MVGRVRGGAGRDPVTLRSIGCRGTSPAICARVEGETMEVRHVVVMNPGKPQISQKTHLRVQHNSCSLEMVTANMCGEM